ncbi:MAG: hypothetical protein ACKOW5_14335 [Actinomycetales bacterium]
MRAYTSWVLICVAIAVGLGCSSSATSVTAATRASAQATHEPAPTPASSTPLRGPAHPDRATIIDGSWLIGADFPPALYLTPTAVTNCHWRVLDYATGTLIEDGNYAGPGPAAIWVGDGDLFQSEGCYLWQGFPQLTGERVTPSGPPTDVDQAATRLGDGTWRVGTDAPPGQYRSDRISTGACSFQVDRGDDSLDESFQSSATYRSIPAYLDLTLDTGDVFTSQDCGEWIARP